MRKLSLLLVLLLTLLSHVVRSAELQLVWSIENKFNMPESATYDAKRQSIYVSNVNHYAKDNNGFISKVSEDGKQLELEWLTGLHSPTGLTVHEDILYAVDFDALVVVDLVKEKIVARIPAVDADEKPVLNDVAVSSQGDVYVSGSRSQKIYKLNGDRLEEWLHSPDYLKTANGLLVSDDLLLHGGLAWTAFHRESKHVVKKASEMGKGLVDIDGITSDGQGGFFTTLIDDPRLWFVQPGKSPKPFTEDKINGIDMQYLPDQNLLILPRVGNTLSVYRIVR